MMLPVLVWIYGSALSWLATACVLRATRGHENRSVSASSVNRHRLFVFLLYMLLLLLFFFFLLPYFCCCCCCYSVANLTSVLSLFVFSTGVVLCRTGDGVCREQRPDRLIHL